MPPWEETVAPYHVSSSKPYGDYSPYPATSGVLRNSSLWHSFQSVAPAFSSKPFSQRLFTGFLPAWCFRTPNNWPPFFKQKLRNWFLSHNIWQHEIFLDNGFKQKDSSENLAEANRLVLACLYFTTLLAKNCPAFSFTAIYWGCLYNQVQFIYRHIRCAVCFASRH